jgi:hypothetical protein
MDSSQWHNYYGGPRDTRRHNYYNPSTDQRIGHFGGEDKKQPPSFHPPRWMSDWGDAPQLPVPQPSSGQPSSGNSSSSAKLGGVPNQSKTDWSSWKETNSNHFFPGHH